MSDRVLTLKGQPHKMVKHTQTIRWQQATNCLSVFDHFVGVVLKELNVPLCFSKQGDVFNLVLFPN